MESIVVDNFSADATPDIATGLADKVLQLGPERSAQRNAGARLSEGKILVFIDSDMVLSPHVASDAAKVLSDQAVGAAVIPEFAFGENFWARCRKLEKELYARARVGEAARCYRRDVFTELGGFDESITGPEDWELPDRVASRGFRIERLDAPLFHDEGNLNLRQNFRKKHYYGRSFTRYVAEARKTRTARALPTRAFLAPAVLVRDPMHAAGLATLKAVDAIAIASGAIAARADRRAAPGAS